VLATDLPGPWLEFAQLTLAANAGRGRPSAAIACDVATALRPASFDLVAANSPWSPAPPIDVDGKELTFMARGSTGTELPARFLREGAALLRPGGTAITLCLDPEFDDGSRPLVPVLNELRADGYEVECVDSPVFPTAIVTERLRKNRLPTLRHARHLAVIVRNEKENV
jgi:methylase of polypeptide subunit release factors